MLINPISYNSFSNNKYSPVRKINNLKNNSISKNNISFNANVRQTGNLPVKTEVKNYPNNYRLL